MKTDTAPSQPSVRALERGIEILDCFKDACEPIPLTIIAEAVDLSPSTALRILSTLEKKGYIIRDDSSKRYSLGPGILRLTAAAQKVNGLASLALPAMRELNSLFDESISVYIASGLQRVCIQRVESSHPLRQVISIGDILPLTIGAGGKILTSWLSTMPNFKASALMPPLSPALLAQVRENGYATSFNERGEGIYGVAAPIFAWNGTIAAALSLSGPTVRFLPDKLPQIAEAVVAKAMQISRTLGWTPDEESS